MFVILFPNINKLYIPNTLICLHNLIYDNVRICEVERGRGGLSVYIIITTNRFCICGVIISAGLVDLSLTSGAVSEGLASCKTGYIS